MMTFPETARRIIALAHNQDAASADEAYRLSMEAERRATSPKYKHDFHFAGIGLKIMKLQIRRGEAFDARHVTHFLERIANSTHK